MQTSKPTKRSPKRRERLLRKTAQQRSTTRRLPMTPKTKLKLAELSELTIGQLATKYEKLFGEKCRSRNRRYVHRRVAWRLQADDEGGLSERAILRATVIAGESLMRVTPPRITKPKNEVIVMDSTSLNWGSPNESKETGNGSSSDSLCDLHS